jgi:hypothetical protein
MVLLNEMWRRMMNEGLKCPAIAAFAGKKC